LLVVVTLAALLMPWGIAEYRAWQEQSVSPVREINEARRFLAEMAQRSGSRQLTEEVRPRHEPESQSSRLSDKP